MKGFDVTIRGSVTKTYRIDTDDEQDAIEAAHEDFTMLFEEGIAEEYNEETVKVVKV